MKTKSLLNVVSAAISGIKSNNKDAQNLLFKNGRLYSWSVAISVSAKLPNDAQDLTGIINGEDLVKFLSKLDKEDIDIACTDDAWTVTADTMSVKLVARIDNELGDKVAKVNNEELQWKPLPTNFYKALAICDIPNNMKKTSGVFMTNNLMVSTDNIRVNRVTLDGIIEGKVWLSQFSVAEISRVKQKFNSYAVSKRWMHFKSAMDSNGVQLEFACNRLDETNYEYEIYAGYIGKVNEATFAEGTLPDISHALSIASCFDDSLVISEKNVFNNIISLTFKKDCVVVSAERAKSGKYKETLRYPNDEPINIDEPMTIKVTSMFLVEASKYSKKFSLAKVGKNTVIKFSGADFDSVVMVLV